MAGHGTEQAFMRQLSAILVAIREGTPLPDFGDLGPDLQDFGSGTPNHKFLRVVARYARAVELGGTPANVKSAKRLVLKIFETMAQGGHFVIAANEILTPSHSQLWYAAAFSALAVASRKGHPQVVNAAVRFLRAEMALCHLCGWRDPSPNKGQFRVVSPGARGGEKTRVNSLRDVVYHFLLTGDWPKPARRDKFFRNKYNVGALALSVTRPADIERLRASGSGEPLQGPPGVTAPWRPDDLPPVMKSTLKVQRLDGDFAAWFDRLEALEPQFGAGIRDGEPWFLGWEPGPRNGGANPHDTPVVPGATFMLEVSTREV